MKIFQIVILLIVTTCNAGCNKNSDSCYCYDQLIREGEIKYELSVGQGNIELTGVMNRFFNYDESSFTVYEDHYTIRILRYSDELSDFIGISFHLDLNNNISNEAFGFKITFKDGNKYYNLEDVPGTTSINNLKFDNITGNCSGTFVYESARTGNDEIKANGEFQVHLYEKALI